LEFDAAEGRETPVDGISQVRFPLIRYIEGCSIVRSKPPRWAIRNCAEPEDDTDTIAASALRDKLAGCVARFADRRDDLERFRL
jgi:hypothetical protein